MNLLSQVRSVFEPVLAGLLSNRDDLPRCLDMVKPTDPKDGDYQANFAMALAKQLGRPKDGVPVAKEIVEKLPANDLLESAVVAGPGFINIKLKDTWLAQQA